MYDFSKKKQVPMYEEEDTDKNEKQETKKKGTGKKNMTKEGKRRTEDAVQMHRSVHPPRR